MSHLTRKEVLSFFLALSRHLLLFRLRLRLEEVDANLLNNGVESAGSVGRSERDRKDRDNRGHDKICVGHSGVDGRRIAVSRGEYG